MKLLQLCILTMFSLVLTITNPLSLAAQGEPQLTEIPSQFTILSETANKNAVQIFDIKSGKIIKEVPNDEKIQRYAYEIIKSISGLAAEISPDSEAKYIVRIPISTPQQVSFPQHKLLIKELFVFYYTTDHALLLVFDDNKKPFLLRYEADIKPLIEYISNTN